MINSLLAPNGSTGQAPCWEDGETLRHLVLNFAKSFVIRPNFAPPTATVTLSPLTQTICSATNVSIDATPTPSTSTIAWTRNETVNVTGLPASGTGDVNGTLVNNTNADITVMFIFTPTFNGNPGDPDTAYASLSDLYPLSILSP